MTGAASGIGKALAAKARAEGMNVVLADVEREALAKVRGELEGGSGGLISALVDVSQPGAVDELARRTLEVFGGVDLFFNNAGVGAGSTVWQSTLEDWTWVMGVNLWGVIHGIRAFVPIMLRQHRPAHIVNTASIAGLVKGHVSAPYAVTKHAVVALTEQLAIEFERVTAPIKASVLCPGWVTTRIMDSERNRPQPLLNKTEMQLTPEMITILQQMQDFVRHGTPPSEIADMVFAEGIRQEKLYIIPHKEWVQSIKDRFDGILKDV